MCKSIDDEIKELKSLIKENQSKSEGITILLTGTDYDYFVLGFKAFTDGIVLEDNPYTLTSIEHTRWVQGYNVAKLKIPTEFNKGEINVI